MKYYNTKYALSTGVTHVDYIPSTFDSNRIYPDKTYSYGLNIGKDAFVNEEDAQKAVEIQRKKKVESLKKQIAKLESQFVKWL